MSNWKKPLENIRSCDESIRWWVKEHFVPTSEWEEGIGAIFLYASYCDAAVATGLPILTGAMFGRIIGGLVPRKRNSAGVNSGATAYQLRARADVQLSEVTFVSGMRGGGLMKQIFRDACNRAGVRTEQTWEEFAENRRLDEKILSRHLVDKHGVRPTLKPGRDALGIIEPADESRYAPVAVKKLWEDFPQSFGWSYIKFLAVIGQVTIIVRHARGKTAYLEKP